MNRRSVTAVHAVLVIAFLARGVAAAEKLKPEAEKVYDLIAGKAKERPLSEEIEKLKDDPKIRVEFERQVQRKVGDGGDDEKKERLQKLLKRIDADFPPEKIEEINRKLKDGKLDRKALKALSWPLCVIWGCSE
ncbi:MAG TPA: hypothetical protein VH475_09065 [Tepidisphaeraceae bacterium]|jgi:hypothetical protein